MLVQQRDTLLWLHTEVGKKRKWVLPLLNLKLLAENQRTLYMNCCIIYELEIVFRSFTSLLQFIVPVA